MSFTTYITGDRPDIRVDRKGWEDSWTKDLEHKIRVVSKYVGKGSIGSGSPGSVPGLSRELYAELNTDDHLLHLEREERAICRLQMTMAKEVCRRITEEDFEARWRAISPAKREEVVLEGLFRAFTQTASDMEMRRGWCPETTLKNLTSSQGETYLRLLKQLMPADLAVPLTEPILVSHPILDRMGAPTPSELLIPGGKLFYRDFHINRSFCITMVVWYVFLAFHGLSVEYIPSKPSRESTKFSPGPNLEIAHDFMKKEAERYKQQRQTAPNGCWNCFQPVQRLLTCSKCLSMGRKVFYCSRECQKDDWKNGKPKPHKMICGKPLSEDGLSGPPDSQNKDCATWVPKADPSFKRPPALLHQINELKTAKRLDYLVINRTKPNIGICFAKDSNEKQLFLVHRNRAFKTGNTQSVRALYTMICTGPYSEKFDVSHASFRKQLEAEYGVVVPEAPIDVSAILPRPDTEEISLAAESGKAQVLASSEDTASPNLAEILARAGIPRDMLDDMRDRIVVLDTRKI